MTQFVDGGVIYIDGGVSQTAGSTTTQVIDGGVMYIDGGTQTQTIIDDGGTRFIDGGTRFIDGGTRFIDGGAMLVDGGAMFIDGGVMFIDGGIVVIDGGITVKDTGIHVGDSGTQVSDSGTSIADSGSTIVDSGVLPDPVVLELANDTSADELVDNWNSLQLQPVLMFPGNAEWSFTCSGGGASTSNWTIRMDKFAADDCIHHIENGPSMDFYVTFISGSSTLSNPYIQCGSNKQVSLRDSNGEWFTFHPSDSASSEGEWCNNTESSGTSPPSSHNLTVTPL